MCLQTRGAATGSSPATGGAGDETPLFGRETGATLADAREHWYPPELPETARDAVRPRDTHRLVDRQMKTFMAKPGEVEQRWWVVDATGLGVGRLASRIAMVLMGKHRPTYTPRVDTGDHVVVVNADKVEFSGKKWQQKEYRWYTGYQGLKTETAEHRLNRRPELIVEEAVRRMLPKTRLGRVMLDKLKVYAGTEHPHQAQQPEALEAGAK